MCTVLRAQSAPAEEPSSEEIFNQIRGTSSFKEAALLARKKTKVYVLDENAAKTFNLPILPKVDLEKAGLLSVDPLQADIEPCGDFQPEINAIVLHGKENYTKEVLAREFFVGEIFNHLPHDFLESFNERPFDSPEEEMKRIAESLARLALRDHTMDPASFTSHVSFHLSEISESINELIATKWSAEMIRAYVSLVLQTAHDVFPTHAQESTLEDVLALTHAEDIRENLLATLRKINWQGPERLAEPFAYTLPSEREPFPVDIEATPEAIFTIISRTKALNLNQAVAVASQFCKVYFVDSNFKLPAAREHSLPEDLIHTDFSNTPSTYYDSNRNAIFFSGSRSYSRDAFFPVLLEAIMFHHLRKSLPDVHPSSELELKALSALVKLHIYYFYTLDQAYAVKLRKYLSEAISCFNEAVFGWDIYADAGKLARFRQFILEADKIMMEGFPTLNTGFSVLEVATDHAAACLAKKVGGPTAWRVEFTEFQKHALVTLGRLDPSEVSKPLPVAEAESMRERIQSAIRRESQREHLPRVTGEEAARLREERGEIPPSFRNRIDRFFDGEGPKDIRPYR